MTVAEPRDEEAHTQPESAGLRDIVRTALRETGDSIGSVARNPVLRRVELALTGSMVGDWAYATAVTVWAYGVGGASAVGLWMAIRCTIMAATAPLAAALVDRFPRKTVMVVADLVRLVLVAVAAACLFLETPAAPIFVLATLTSVMGTPFRCAQRALMPTLADNPEELTAANGASSTIESLAFFVGPAVGALLIGLFSIPIVFCLNCLTFVWSMAMVLGIHMPPQNPPPDNQAADDAGEDAENSGPGPEGFFAEIAGGFRAIRADRDLLVITTLVCAQTVVTGASSVFLVVMAVEVLDIGAHGVGYLEATLGVGAVIGGFLAIARAGRNRLAQDLATGVLLWSVPLLTITALPSPVTVSLAVALLGLANPLVDVNVDTIIQRVTPDAVLGRVFGALEACAIATIALGAAAMPVLLDQWGLRTALAVVAVGVGGFALPFLPRMRRLDARLTAPVGLELLSAVPMFAPLPRAVVEGLAGRLVPMAVPAGDDVLREGEDSDRFFVIESGLVEVTQGGVVLRREGPGEFFGEIGLLRDVARIATVTALEDTVMRTLARDDFLTAVSGHRTAFLAADEIISRRLMV